MNYGSRVITVNENSVSRAILLLRNTNFFKAFALFGYNSHEIIRQVADNSQEFTVHLTNLPK